MKLSIKETVHEKTTPEEIIALILANRGIGKSKKENFLHPQNPSDFSLEDVGISTKDFDKTIKRLQKAHKGKEKIVVYADYDVDGITGGTILWTTLHELGFNVSPHVSYRGTEGYGFSTQSVERLKKDHTPKIIITVDHGITGEPFIKVLKKEGIDVIVFDHHLAVHGLPKSAYALLYTKMLCGSGVSYFVSREIANKFSPNKKLDQLSKIDFPVLAGIGTIADIVPLIGPSRALASFALKNISKTTLVGFQSLLKHTGLAEKKSHTSYDIGFIIGPRINAAGRMGDALDSLRLLCTTNETRARDLLGKIETYNKNRQKQVIDHLKVAEKIAENQSDSKIFFIASEIFEEGTVGLLAAKLTEKYYCPTLVGVIKNGIIKGSARSIAGIHITDILLKNSKLLLTFGGHERAAGFSLAITNQEKFEKILIDEGNKAVYRSAFEKSINIDVEMPLNVASLPLAREISALEPFGEGNDKPLFLARDVEILDHKNMGATGKHVQLKIMAPGMRFPIRAVYFNGADKMERFDKTIAVSILFFIEINNWRGEELSIHIKDILSSQNSK